MGLNPKGVDVRCAIAAWPWGTYLGEDGLNKGIRVRISSFARHHINITMTKAKACGYYINSILAKAEAHRDGYDEGILLDPNGYVSEGSGENIFIYSRTGSITKKWVEKEFGKYGLEVLSLMLKENILLEVDKNDKRYT